jgi:hypothetical protein
VKTLPTLMVAHEKLVEVLNKAIVGKGGWRDRGKA